jgi:tetratricopeptide (TPR) repeat protein
MKDRRKRNPKPRAQAAPTTPRLTGWKLWRWRLLSVVAVPLAVLALIELALRLAGYGYPTSFLLPSANHRQKTFVQNNKFGWRFFSKHISRTPNPISILQEKAPGTVRIFVFGESAAYGDPQPAFGLSRVLQATLSLRHPRTKFEVVNTAMTAIDSHVILPIARDCARAGGDIWVIYMGNNEVVGPFGAGTVFGPQAPPLAFIRASVALKTTCIGQLIDAARQQWQKPPPDKSEWGGMQMFLDQQVPADDPRMANVYRNFQRNLEDIVRLGRDHGAGVVVSTVAVNLKDCAPFASRHRANFSESGRRKWDDLCRLGVQAQSAARMSEALIQFQAAAQLDDASAELQFRLGRCQLALGDVTGARKSLSAARDLDTLRFRCDSRLNELARQTAAGREADRVLLADAEGTFAAASSDGLPGADFFYEHVHLTFEGNCLLARTVAEQVEKLLPRDASNAGTAWPTVEDCARRLGRTDRDFQAALADMLGRLTEPPFTAQINHDEQVQRLTTRARELAGMDKTAGLARALQAAHDALAAAPDDAQLYEQASALEDAAGHQAEAETAARRAVELLPSSEEGWSQLGFTFVEEKKYEDATKAFQRAFDLDSEDVWPLQNLAMSLAKLNRKDEAMLEYRRALAITPRFGMAWLGLGQLLEGMGRKDEAAECFEKGLRNPIHHAPELATLARFCKSRAWFEAASTNYNAAIKLDPSDPALRFESGQSLAALGRHSEAAERYREATQLSPEWGQAHFQSGMELGKCGQLADAAREFQEAARLMPDVLEARLNLGITFYQEGKRNEALNEFEQVAERSPTNAVARHYLKLLRTNPASQEQK